jgi:hypothetical protein
MFGIKIALPSDKVNAVIDDLYEDGICEVRATIDQNPLDPKISDLLKAKDVLKKYDVKSQKNQEFSPERIFHIDAEINAAHLKVSDNNNTINTLKCLPSTAKSHGEIIVYHGTIDKTKADMLKEIFIIETKEQNNLFYIVAATTKTNKTAGESLLASAGFHEIELKSDKTLEQLQNENNSLSESIKENTRALSQFSSPDPLISNL